MDKHLRNFGLAVCVLASGSKGNAIYVSDGRSSILIDAGLSGREIERRLQSQGLRAEELCALVLSHEHADHVQGVGVLSRRYRLPVYITRKTAGAAYRLGDLSKTVYIECGVTFSIAGLEIHPFSLSHDARDPAGFTIRSNGLKLGIVTDLGVVTSMVREHLKGCHALVLEANHDDTMLLNGPYPWPLKQRIRSRMGHLSNADSSTLLGDILHDRLQHVILAHLSEINNTPEEALRSVSPTLIGSRTQLHIARQHRCGELIVIR